MKKLLFISGNRCEIDKANVVEAYNKIKAWGFIEDMPIEFIPIEDAISKLGERKLMKPAISRKSGEGEAVISNFEIKLEPVDPDDYKNYDGICADGQHRTLAMMFDSLTVEPFYQGIKLPEGMDVLTYISMRNNGKKWSNTDFYKSEISTGEERLDYILEKISDKYPPAFLFSIYTLGTGKLTADQIKALQQGYKKISDFGKIQLSDETQKRGDEILRVINESNFFTKDRLTGRFASGLKTFYETNNKNFPILIDVLARIDKDIWDESFTGENGKSMEAKSFALAFQSVKEQYIDSHNEKVNPDNIEEPVNTDVEDVSLPENNSVTDIEPESSDKQLE